jgi:hypothetical protein
LTPLGGISDHSFFLVSQASATRRTPHETDVFFSPNGG